MAIIGAVATALAAAVFTSSRIDSLFGWVGGGAPTSGTTSQANVSPSKSAKVVRSADGGVTLTVPAEWGSAPAPYDMPIDGIIDAGSGVRSGTGAGLTTAHAYDEPSAYVGASVETAQRLKLAGRTEADYVTYLRQLLEKDDYTVDGCTYAGQRQIEKEGYVVVIDTWATCRGFRDAEFRNMFAISVDGSHFVVGSAVSVGASREVGEEALASFAIRPAALDRGEATPGADKRYPLPRWFARVGGDRAGTP
ncbi:hypothetical protein [Humibacillus xanthopallidus]|uniref:hypothetical protein n=1 Tax=Humibacillus xanthopallidus TaxID=412689 RepID=UPI00384AF387